MWVSLTGLSYQKNTPCNISPEFQIFVKKHIRMVEGRMTCNLFSTIDGCSVGYFASVIGTEAKVFVLTKGWNQFVKEKESMVKDAISFHACECTEMDKEDQPFYIININLTMIKW